MICKYNPYLQLNDLLFNADRVEVGSLLRGLLHRRPRVHLSLLLFLVLASNKSFQTPKILQNPKIARKCKNAALITFCFFSFFFFFALAPQYV